MSSNIIKIEGWDLARLDGEAEEERRVRDVDLAERLGFKAPRMVRKLIARHRAILETLGDLPVRSTVVRGRNQHGETAHSYEVSEFWINEPQALFITAKSETAEANAVTVSLIRTYIALRRHVFESRVQAPQTVGRDTGKELCASFRAMAQLACPAPDRKAIARARGQAEQAFRRAVRYPYGPVRDLPLSALPEADTWIRQHLSASMEGGYGFALDSGDLSQSRNYDLAMRPRLKVVK